MMFNVQSINEIDQKDKLSSQSFQRANSLPAPCGIKTENLISVQNRGSIGAIVVPTQHSKQSNIGLKAKIRKRKYILIFKIMRP